MDNMSKELGMHRMVHSSRKCLSWVPLCSLLASAIGKAQVFFSSSPCGGGNAKWEKKINKNSFSRQGYWGSEWSGDLPKIQQLLLCGHETHCHCCSVTKSCPTLWDPMDCSTTGFSVLHYFPEFAQIHVHWVGDAIQPSHPLSSPFSFAFNLSQHQGLFQRVGLSHQVAKVLELQLQHQSFQWIFRVDSL